MPVGSGGARKALREERIPDYKVLDLRPGSFVDLRGYDDEIYVGVGGPQCRLLKSSMTGVLETFMSNETAQNLWPGMGEIVTTLKMYNGLVFASLHGGTPPIPRIARYDPTTKKWSLVFTVPDPTAITIYQMEINHRGYIFAAVVGTGNGHVYRSVDLGITWTEVLNVAGDSVHSISQSPYFGGMLAGTNSGRIYRSIDYGATFALQYTSPEGLRIRGIQLTLEPLNVLACDDGGHVYRSTDLGVTWNPVADMNWGSFAPNVLCCSPLGDIFYVASDFIFRSTDDGQTWKQFLTIPFNRTGLDFRSIHATQTHLYLGTAYAVAEGLVEMDEMGNSARMIIVRYR